MNWTSLIGIALWALLPGFIAKKKERSFWAYYLLSFVITPLVTTIITICLRKVKMDDAQLLASNEKQISEPVLGGTISEEESSKTKDVGEPRMLEDKTPRKIMYCRRCGSKLLEGSDFCSNCGNEIEKESNV